MKSKSANKIVVSTAFVLLAGAGTAFGGEITGNARWIAGSPTEPLNGRSECAFSGQNDEFQLGDENAPRTQSWGTIPKAVRDFLATVLGMHPGDACNPRKAGASPG